MAIKSIHVTLPDTKPFDRGDWFEQFVGHFVLPVLATNLVQSYWFTRYQDPTKHARLRLKTADYAPLKPTVDGLIGTLHLTDKVDEEDYADNEFTGKRWCGEKTPAVVPATRQKLVWDYLAASAALYVDTYSHADADGYWIREVSHDRGNNIDGDTMESAHHILCNMTAVRPRVEMIEKFDERGFRRTQLIAGTYRRWSGLPDELVGASQRVNF